MDDQTKDAEETKKWINSLKIEGNKWVYPLEEPIEIGKKKIESLHLERPKAKHWRDVSTKMKMGDFFNVISSVSHEPPSTIDELGMKDANKLIEFIGYFG